METSIGIFTISIRKVFKAALICGFISLMAFSNASADCTMALIGKGGSADGSILVYHNEELSPNTSQRFEIVPRITHDPDETIIANTYVEVPQVPLTYKTVVAAYGQGGYGPGDSDWAAGINEFGVTLAANRMSSKETALPAGYGVPYGWLTQITLERSKTAREAVLVLGGLIDTYGRASGRQSTWALSDPNEAWVLEQSVTHWVARRVHDDELYIVSGAYKIAGDYELSSPDVVSYAIGMGWYDPASGVPFSWKDVYGRGTPLAINWVLRENRIKELLLPKWGQITVADMLELTRDHFEGTDAYYYPPHAYPGIGMYSICSGQCVFGMVYQLRNWLPTEIGSVMWHNMAAPCSSVHIPIYSGITEVPYVYEMPLSTQPDSVSAWWRFMNLRINVDTDYEALNPHVRKAWEKFEEQELNEVEGLEARALRAYQNDEVEKAQKMLTQSTNTYLIRAYNKVQALNNWVLDQMEPIE